MRYGSSLLCPAPPERRPYCHFLAYNISTAFSPTDTAVLSARAKILMMLQVMLSLLVLAVLAARAINTL